MINQTPHSRHMALSRITTQTVAPENRHTRRYGVIDPKGKTPYHLLFWLAAYLFFCLSGRRLSRVMSILSIHMTQFNQSNGGSDDE